MTTPARIPHGAWPRQMPADMAAGYVGEKTAQGFRRRIPEYYPKPIRIEGVGERWLIDDLDAALNRLHGKTADQCAAELI